MADAAAREEAHDSAEVEHGFKRTVKDLGAGAAGGVAQVLLGELIFIWTWIGVGCVEWHVSREEAWIWKGWWCWYACSNAATTMVP